MSLYWTTQQCIQYLHLFDVSKPVLRKLRSLRIDSYFFLFADDAVIAGLGIHPSRVSLIMEHLSSLNIFEMPVDDIIRDAKHKIDSGSISVPKANETKQPTSRRSVTYAEDFDLAVKASQTSSSRSEIARMRSHDPYRVRSRDAGIRPSRSRSIHEGRDDLRHIDTYETGTRRNSLASQFEDGDYSHEYDYCESGPNFESGLHFILSRSGGSLLASGEDRQERGDLEAFLELRRNEEGCCFQDEFEDISDFPGIVQLVHRDRGGSDGKEPAKCLEEVFGSIEEISVSSPGTDGTFASDSASRLAYLRQKIEILWAIDEDERRTNAVLKLRLEEVLRLKTREALRNSSGTDIHYDPVSARRGREALAYFREQLVSRSPFVPLNIMAV